MFFIFLRKWAKPKWSRSFVHEVNCFVRGFLLKISLPWMIPLKDNYVYYIFSRSSANVKIFYVLAHCLPKCHWTLKLATLTLIALSWAKHICTKTQSKLWRQRHNFQLSIQCLPKRHIVCLCPIISMENVDCTFINLNV